MCYKFAQFKREEIFHIDGGEFKQLYDVARSKDVEHDSSDPTGKKIIMSCRI